MNEPKQVPPPSGATVPEPWLRGTLLNVPPVARGVLHALELAQEDLQKYCAGLTDEEVNTHPAGLAPVAFHLRHIARSLDRLLTYAEGRALTPQQLIELAFRCVRGAIGRLESQRRANSRPGSRRPK